MHTVELMEQALAVAEAIGYGIRQEYLGGIGGGGCEIAGKKWLFLDVALNATEQLAQAIEVLQNDPATYSLTLSAELSQALGIRRAA